MWIAASLQASLVQNLLDASELALARDFASQYCIDLDLFRRLAPEEEAAALLNESERYLQLPLPASAVVWVDSEEMIEIAEQAIMDADIVGIDTESRPSRDLGERNQISLLQVQYPCHARALWLEDIFCCLIIINL